MATTVDLVFKAAPLTTQPINLVFNESDGGPSLDRSFVGDGMLPALAGTSAVTGAVVLVGEGALPLLSGQSIFGGASILVGSGLLPELSGSTRVVYNSDTQRPLVGTVRDSFQNGLDLEVGVASRMQDAVRLRKPMSGVYQDALPLQAGFEARWQQARRLRELVDVHYQRGLKARNGFDDGFTDARRRRHAVADGYQQGVKARNGFTSRFQDTLKRRGVVSDSYQQASRYVAGSVVSRAHRARKASHLVEDHYQQAIKPGGGLWFRPPVTPTDPCYVPSTDLVFLAPWSADTALVFVCERHGGDPVDPTDTIVIPVRRIYTVINSAVLRRVDGNVLIPNFAMSLTIDVDSWTWGFTARVPGAALPDLEPDGGEPVELEATINGVAYRALVESISRDRVFGRSDLNVSGRGKAALLDAPYSPVQTFGNPDNARTAQQLANDVLTLNGVPIGWDIDAGWSPEDWLVPAGVFSHQGSYITALNAIAGAAGAYLQPHRTANALSVLKRYPAKPWEWGDVTPDFELPADVVQKEGIVWTDKPIYNRVYVRGMKSGRMGVATREGTAGELEAPMVTDALITNAIAARQRAVAVLSDVGRQAAVTLRLPVLAETGIIPPGKFVRYVDGGITRIGLVRSTSAEVVRAEKKLTIWQTIGVETHVGV